MKSLAASNPYLRTASARKEGVERNVRSSSAIEGISGKAFGNAITSQHMAIYKGRSPSVVEKGRQK